ncbi:MAG: ABC transporter ATP-binding protein [Lachnospiraceae bacterium]|nr:ABC transporter ATP-binding protein [Lachnospiraceae bacterium]
MWQCSWFMIVTAWKEKEKKVLVLSCLTAVLAVISNLINLYISPAILGTVERKAPISELLITTAVFVGALMLCQAVSTYINANTIYGRITVRLAIIKAVNKKAATTSYSNMDDEKFIKLNAKSGDATSGNSQATEAVWGTLTSLLQNVIGFVIYVMLLSHVNMFLIAIIVVTALCGYFVRKHLNEYEYRHREEFSEQANKLWYTIETSKNYSTAKDIRIFGIKPWLVEVGDSAMATIKAMYRKAEGVYIWGHVFETFLAVARNGIAYLYLINLVLGDGLMIADFLLYFSAVGGFTSWITGILSNLSTLHKQSLDLSTVREFIEYPEVFKFEEGEDLIVDKNKKYELRLEAVSFRYPGADKDTLSNINLTLHPGEKLAVVGLNGAGKTTLVKLMCGFLDPTEGRVLLDGKDIRDYNREHYYTLFAAVFQNFSLLAGTVATNVAQTEEEIDIERVKRCIADAGLTDKIESLKNGYMTNLNREIYEDAVMLSGGETQRLMLARALYKDAPFVVLDEPTAALDPIAESEMYQKYNEMISGKSSVYISHRLASTRFCDRIILIEDACIIEEGTHEELLSKDGRYAELFTVQSKYYKEGAIEDEE